VSQTLPKSSGQPLLQDSVSSLPPVADNESLVPSDADVLVSYACLPASAADRCAGKASVYVRGLVDHLRPGVDVIDALNKVNQQFSTHAKAVVVSTFERPLVFPYKQ